MATHINEAKLIEKCEKAAKYGLKRRGRTYFKTKEEEEFACFYFDANHL